MTELGRATFASSVRTTRVGARGSLAAGDVPRLVVEESLIVTGTSDSGQPDPHPVTAKFELLGPGDVTGIVSRQILRVFPNGGDGPAEPNYLASIDFDRPELPWLVSLSVGEPVQPWIALVVVPYREDRVTDRASSPLSWLVVDDASELPPPGELWAWAHAQSLGAASLASPAPGDGRQTLSRLLCPTRMYPDMDYIAAVVPTYEAGVRAARNENPAGVGNRAAWGEDPGPLKLPIYHHWRFQTGAAGDFEALATDLAPINANKIDKLGRIDLRPKTDGLGDLPPDELHPVRTLLVNPAESARQDDEAPVLNGAVPEAIESAIEGAKDDRILRPPRYGQWPVGDGHVRDGPSWYAELNLQPNHRVIARLGADLIRTQQEELVADARRQLGEYRAARRARDLLRLGEITATRLHQRAVAKAPDERLVTMARPALKSLVADTDPRVAETMATDGFAASLLASSFARIAQRVSARTGVPAAQMRAEFIAGAMKGDLVSLPVIEARPRIDDTNRIRKVFHRAGTLNDEVDGLRVDQLLALVRPALEAQEQLISEFRDAPIEIQQVQVAAAPVDQQPPGDGGNAGGALLHGLDHLVGQIHPNLEPPDRLGKLLPNVHDAVAKPAHFPNLAAALHVDKDPPKIADLGIGPAAVQALQIPPEIAHLGIGAATHRALRIPPKLADLRLDGTATDRMSLAIGDATTTLRQVAVQQGLPEAATRFTDLVVDRHTMDLAAAIDPGGAQTLVQLDARDAVRRSVGLPVLGPVLHDRLTVEGQRQFDDVVATLAGRQVTDDLRFPPAPPRVTVNQVVAPCRLGLLAETSYQVVATQRLPFAPNLVPSLIPMGFVPKFDVPLASRLQKAENQWIMAGADRVPPNTISVVMTNPAFIEAFIAGANHEIARELLWRDVPWDARGTVFRHFWNPRPDRPDDKPIHRWQHSLGKNLETASPDHDTASSYLGVLVRSPLLRRYPNALVHAAQGKIEETEDGPRFDPDPATFKTLLFHGEIAPDMTFSVIDLTKQAVLEASDSNPWFLLLGEPVTDPKFGLDTDNDHSPKQLKSWQNLAWTDFDEATTVLRVGDKKLADAGDKKLPGFPVSETRGEVTWGTNAAAMARILHQDPFRLVLEARHFLKFGG